MVRNSEEEEICIDHCQISSPRLGYNCVTMYKNIYEVCLYNVSKQECFPSQYINHYVCMLTLCVCVCANNTLCTQCVFGVRQFVSFNFLYCRP